MRQHSCPFCLSWVQSKELPRHGLCRSDFFLLKFFQESSAEAGVVGSSAAFSLLPNGTNRNGAAQNTMADAHWFTFHRYNSCEITSHQAMLSEYPILSQPIWVSCAASPHTAQSTNMTPAENSSSPLVRFRKNNRPPARTVAAKSAAEISSHRSLLTLTLPSESLMMANRLPSASSSRKQTCPARTQNTGTLHQARFASFMSTAPFHCCPAAFPPQISSPMSGASTPHPRSGPATTASPHIPYRRPMRPSALRESESCSQTGRIG